MPYKNKKKGHRGEINGLFLGVVKCAVVYALHTTCARTPSMVDAFPPTIFNAMWLLSPYSVPHANVDNIIIHVKKPYRVVGNH